MVQIRADTSTEQKIELECVWSKISCLRRKNMKPGSNNCCRSALLATDIDAKPLVCKHKNCYRIHLILQLVGYSFSSCGGLAAAVML